MARVIIIGGGASGVLLAAHLLRTPHAGLHVTLVEQREELGAGVAYSTNNRSHLLNVRASNMSAFADDEDHFVRWLRAHVPSVAEQLPSPFYFAPRHLYRDYLAGLLAPHFADGRLERVHGTAISVAEQASSVTVEFADGRSLVGDKLVIATGNEGPTLPPAPWRYDGWQSAAALDVPPDAPLVMIGTGLTMIDWALSLLNKGHRGTITAISPRGLISHAHRPSRPLAIAAADVPFGQPLPLLTRWIRGEVKKAEASGGDWRSVVDALRPHTQRLWQAFSLADKRRFLRHARPWWDQHRHRIAPSAAEAISAARASGKLRIVTARLVSFEPLSDGVDVIVRNTRSGRTQRLYAGAVFECRGRASDITNSANPFLQSLLRNGQARPDALRLGLDVTSECAVIGANGDVAARLFAIGPVTSGVFWESIAVPDIRLQAARVARQLLEQAV